MALDAQAHKRTTAEAYAFQDDSRWSDYWNNILLPPHLSSRPEVRRHFQLNFYQRFFVRATSNCASLLSSLNRNSSSMHHAKLLLSS